MVLIFSLFLIQLRQRQRRLNYVNFYASSKPGRGRGRYEDIQYSLQVWVLVQESFISNKYEYNFFFFYFSIIIIIIERFVFFIFISFLSIISKQPLILSKKFPQEMLIIKDYSSKKTKTPSQSRCRSQCQSRRAEAERYSVVFVLLNSAGEGTVSQALVRIYVLKDNYLRTTVTSFKKNTRSCIYIHNIYFMYIFTYIRAC